MVARIRHTWALIECHGPNHMLYATLKTLHLLSVMVWIGGMVFAHFFLRPALTFLEVPDRMRLMHAVLGRFFNAVILAAGLALTTGAWMMGRIGRADVQSGLKVGMPLEWVAMATLGLVMIGIFSYIRFVLYRRLSASVSVAAWPNAGAVLAHIRSWVMVNLALGVLIVVITLSGASV